MKYIYKLILKFAKYLSYDKVFTFRLLYTILFDGKRNKIKFYSEQELVQQIVLGKSIIRFGDGETALMLGESIHFQDFNVTLLQQLRQIVKNYNSSSQFVICVAQRYIQARNYELREKNLFGCWVVSKAYFKYRFKQDLPYGDAHMFYINGFFEKNIAPIIYKKHIIVVTNKSNIELKKINLEKIFINTSWIETSDKNSFKVIDEVKQKILDIVSKKENTVVLTSTGPMGKVLAHQLIQSGIQSIDIGHGMATLFEEDNTLQNVLI